MGDADQSLWVALESLLGWSSRERQNTPEKDNWEVIVGFVTGHGGYSNSWGWGEHLKDQGKQGKLLLEEKNQSP